MIDVMRNKAFLDTLKLYWIMFAKGQEMTKEIFFTTSKRISDDANL